MHSTVKHGAASLKDEGRATPFLLWFTKTALVQYRPMGVIGVIVPYVVQL